MKTIHILLIACSTLSLTAFAEPSKKFTKSDTNGDGFLDAEEYKAYQIERAEKKIKNNGLMGAEADAAREKVKSRHAKRFKKNDTNGDGKIDAAEFDAK